MKSKTLREGKRRGNSFLLTYAHRRARHLENIPATLWNLLRVYWNDNEGFYKLDLTILSRNMRELYCFYFYFIGFQPIRVL